MKIIRGATKPKGLRIVIYGVPGVGKTTLAAKLPNALFFDYENGSHGIDIAKVEPTDLPNTFAALNGAFNEFRRDSQGFRNLVIDTADRLEERLDKAYAAALKSPVESVFSVNDYGRTVAAFTTAFGTMLDIASRLVESGVNVVFLAHEQIRKREVLEGTQTYDHSELKLSKGSSKLLVEWADVIIFCAYKTFLVEGDKSKGEKSHAEGGKRWCFSVYSPDWEAKHRSCIDIPDDCSMDKMADILPRAIVDAVDNGAVPLQPIPKQEPKTKAKAKKGETTSFTPAEGSMIGTPVPPAPAAEPPHVVQFRRLLSQYEITEEQIRAYAAEKLNDRYGIDCKTLAFVDWPEDAVQWLNRGFDKIAPKIKSN